MARKYKHKMPPADQLPTDEELLTETICQEWNQLRISLLFQLTERDKNAIKKKNISWIIQTVFIRLWRCSKMGTDLRAMLRRQRQ